MRALLIEDEKEIVNFLKPGLEAECFTVDVSYDGANGSYLARTNDYDLIILDYILPKMDGKTVCEKIREDNKSVPIIMLTVKSEVEDKVALFNAGVDDYIAKPFSFVELLARIRAILRRPQKIEEEILRINDLILDMKGHTVKLGDNEIYLTRKEFSLLAYLMKNKGNVVSRGMIMEHVWDMNADPFSNTIEAHILNLRRKVDISIDRKFIHTIPGRGYKFS